MANLSILRPGMFTTVQDLGRWGFQARGVPVSGAMDQYSHRRANRIVGNADGAATLEATLVGPEIAFETAAAFAVTGAVFALSLDGQAIEMDRRVEGRAGSVLKFGERVTGARAYIAVAGGIDVPLVLGSRSTHVLTRMGGLEGRALRAGDRLKTGSDGAVAKTTHEPAIHTEWPRGGARLRVIPGEDMLFDRVVSRRFRISPRSNRMGYRLDDPAAPPGPTRTSQTATGELISRAVATGTIQVPPTGEPILLMADHATTGGYAMAGTVITADLPLAAQLAPGDWIEFQACDMKDADRALVEMESSIGRG